MLPYRLRKSTVCEDLSRRKGELGLFKPEDSLYLCFHSRSWKAAWISRIKVSDTGGGDAGCTDLQESTLRLTGLALAQVGGHSDPISSQPVLHIWHRAILTSRRVLGCILPAIPRTLALIRRLWWCTAEAERRLHNLAYLLDICCIGVGCGQPRLASWMSCLNRK